MGQQLHQRQCVEQYKIVKREFAERYNLNPKTVVKWKKRSSTQDAAIVPNINSKKKRL